MPSLRATHAAAAVAHGIQSAYGFYLTNVTNADKGYFELKNGETSLGQYQLGNVVSAFPALSMINHVWSVVDQPRYNQVLKQGYNPVRWGEYSISAGLMYWVIAQLCGITDIKVLSMLAVSNVALQEIGYSIEKDVALGNTGSAMRQEFAGFITFVATWIPLFVGFFTALQEAKGDVPSVIYSIVFILFALMLCFGVWSVLYAVHRIKSFETVEKGYLVLSFVSKSLLTNLTLFGALRPRDPASKSLHT